MRNLKRALSLALASVMLLGMMVVGTSAASYPDVDEKDNVEAIEVLNAVKVMIGDRGNFRPDAKVNRHEMAVIMAKLVLGNEAADNYVGSHPFTDVFPWADKYVAACYENGLVSGTSATTFSGNQPLTAVQAAAMMLRALGYKDLSKGATDWRAPVTAMANQIRLFNGVASNPKEELNRNQVAQLALNTLKSPVVDLKDNTFDVSSGDGAIVISGGSREYIVRSSREDYAQAINSTEYQGNSASGVSGYTVELGEHLYNGKLTLREDNAAGWDVSDAFGRPARHWEYDGKEIGTYAKYESMRHEYTAKVTGKMLYDLLGKEVVDHYDINITIDGETTYSVLNGHGYFSSASMTRTNTDKVGETGNGVLTQVFVDGVNKTVDIAIINTYLAKARQDYNSRDNDVDLTVYKIDDAAVSKHYAKTADETEIMTVEGEDFAIEDVKEDDLFLVTVAEGEIKTMVKPEILSETTINAFKNEDWVKTADAQYDYATTAQYDAEVLDDYSQTNMKDVTYNIILDKYGYLIGIELNEEVNQYAFLTGLDTGGSHISAKNADANLIFLDGTMKTVSVNTEKSELASQADDNNDGTDFTITGGGAGFAGGAQLNTWCTYTVDGNGVYTLKQVGDRSNARTSTPAVRGAKKVAQSAMDMTALTMATKDAQTVVINAKNVSLEGSKIRHDGTTTAANPNRLLGDFDYVYGDDKTVFINVDLKHIDDKDGHPKDIVDKVASFATGVKNVDITVTDLTAKTPVWANPPADEIYVLYGDNGYIIGVVTLDAEDNGSSSSWAYITGSVNQEEYLGNSDWRWTREAIIDGRAVKLTEVDDEYNWLSPTKMQTGNWYELRFDADGNVTKLVPNNSPTTPNRIDFTNITNDKFVTDVEHVRAATNGINLGAGLNFSQNDSVLLFSDFTCNTAPHTGGNNKANLRYENGTLYTDNGISKGFSVDPAVKVAVALSNKHGSGEFDKIVDTYEGWKGLEDALKSLDCEKSAFDGYLSAVFSNGRATSIILDDRSGSNTGANENAPKMTVKVTKLGDDGKNLGVQTIQWDGTAFDGSEVTNPAGYTWVSATPLTFVEKGTGDVTFNYAKYKAPKVTKANASALDGLAQKDDIVDKSRGARVTADGDDIIVTGTLKEGADATKTWFNNPAYDYFLPLVFQAPEDITPAPDKMVLTRDGGGNGTPKTITLTGGKETVVVGLSEGDSEINFEIVWQEADGTPIRTTETMVDLSGVNYEPTAEEETELDYILDFQLSSATKFQKMGTVDLDGKSMAPVELADVEAALDAYNTANHTCWKVKTYTTKYVSAANNTTPIVVAIEWETVKLKMPASLGLNAGDLTVAWAADTDKGINVQAGTNLTAAGVDVPKGVQLTIGGTKVGKYNSVGDDATKLTLTAEKALAATDFGYYKISMNDPAVGTVAVTNAANTATAVMDAPVYAKAAGNVTVKITVTADGGDVAQNSIKVTATDKATGVTAATLTPDGTSAETHTAITDGNELEISVTVAFAAAPDHDILIQVALAE